MISLSSNGILLRNTTLAFQLHATGTTGKDNNANKTHIFSLLKSIADAEKCSVNNAFSYSGK